MLNNRAEDGRNCLDTSTLLLVSFLATTWSLGGFWVFQLSVQPELSLSNGEFSCPPLDRSEACGVKGEKNLSRSFGSFLLLRLVRILNDVI